MCFLHGATVISEAEINELVTTYNSIPDIDDDEKAMDVIRTIVHPKSFAGILLSLPKTEEHTPEGWSATRNRMKGKIVSRETLKAESDKGILLVAYSDGKLKIPAYRVVSQAYYRLRVGARSQSSRLGDKHESVLGMDRPNSGSYRGTKSVCRGFAVSICGDV
jgi:hypothetical protein